MISYNCGCTFRTYRMDEAREHVKQTKHTVEVYGRVTPGEIYAEENDGAVAPGPPPRGGLKVWREPKRVSNE